MAPTFSEGGRPQGNENVYLLLPGVSHLFSFSISVERRHSWKIDAEAKAVYFKFI